MPESPIGDKGVLWGGGVGRSSEYFLSFKWNWSLYIYLGLLLHSLTTHWSVRIMLLYISLEVCPRVPDLLPINRSVHIPTPAPPPGPGPRIEQETKYSWRICIQKKFSFKMMGYKMCRGIVQQKRTHEKKLIFVAKRPRSHPIAIL